VIEASELSLVLRGWEVLQHLCYESVTKVSQECHKSVGSVLQEEGGEIVSQESNKSVIGGQDIPLIASLAATGLSSGSTCDENDVRLCHVA
jgi:hypothetical protein